MCIRDRLIDYYVRDYFAEKSSDYDCRGIVWKEGCFEPVSYTHLDVYKRQVWICALFMSRSSM